MKKLRMLLAALLITVFIIPYSATRAESTETPVNMSIDIVQDSTEAVVGETITASWTYTAALPLETSSVQLFMCYDDGTSECILYTLDQSVTSFSYTPTQAGRLELRISINGADGRHLSKGIQWTITKGAVPPKAPGDADNDGATNINDAIAILQYLANGSANVNLRNADFNGDGEVNNYDVLLILQRVAGWN